MPPPVISVERLSKRYLVGHRAERGGSSTYTALRDVMGRELRNAVRKAADVVRGRQVVQGDAVEEFWALNDVSFEVQEGEVLGIIGRNGAGKSTLLKILSRITEPTSGRVTLRGRVASLLEVGTGFHPELTGRENIYLNGAILGMSRAEIRKKFDEIVAFAEIERFLDTPVKRYSSGMYVRLAFAVAAHLEPEILVVDEVLAVGDAEFQKKCLGKMDEVSRREGRTVLFVSHNMSAVRSLCSRSLFLQDSRIVADGSPERITDAYMMTLSAKCETPRRLDGSLTLEAFDLTKRSMPAGSTLGFEVRISATILAKVDDIAALIYSASGIRVAIIDLRSPNGPYMITPGRELRIQGEVRKFPFVEGEYVIGLWLSCGRFQSDVYDLAKVQITAPEHRLGPRPREARHRGVVELDYIFGEVTEALAIGAEESSVDEDSKRYAFGPVPASPASTVAIREPKASEKAHAARSVNS
jgi:lipopolysaccharide transport system ATP-binding protein